MKSISSLFALLVLVPCVAAQEDLNWRSVSAVESEWHFDVEGRNYTEADFSDFEGSMEVSRVAVDLGRTWRGKSSSFDLSFRHTNSVYDFDAGGTANLGAAGGFEDAREDQLFARWESFEEGEPRWYFTGSLAIGRERGENSSDGLYGEVAGGLLWNVTPDFDLGIGVIGRSKLEDDAEFVPIPVFDWRITDWLQVGITHEADPAFRGELWFTDHVYGFGEIAYDNRQFRTPDGGLISDVAVTDEELAILGGLAYEADHFHAEIFGGFFERELTVDADDVLVNDEETDTDVFIGLGLGFSI